MTDPVQPDVDPAVDPDSPAVEADEAVEEESDVDADVSGDELQADLEASVTEYVEWRGSPYIEKGLTVEDLRTLGAQGDNLREVWWNRSNRHRVLRSDIPLTDAQLEYYFGTEPGRFARVTV